MVPSNSPNLRCVWTLNCKTVTFVVPDRLVWNHIHVCKPLSRSNILERINYLTTNYMLGFVCSLVSLIRFYVDILIRVELDLS